jgi:hypothetical protein
MSYILKFCFPKKREHFDFTNWQDFVLRIYWIFWIFWIYWILGFIEQIGFTWLIVCIEYIGFIGFLWFIGFIGFLGFIAFIVYIDYIKSIGFIGFLGFIKSVKLDHQPWKVKGTNSIICIESNSSCGINFYNLNDFNLIQNYDHGLCTISQINSNIYEFCSKTKTIYCYDERANVKEEIALNVTNDSLAGVWDGLFIRFNGFVLMTSDSKKKIIKFSLKFWKTFNFTKHFFK